MSLTITVHDTEPIPTGEYRVKLTELTTVEGKYGEQIRWTLEVVDGEHAGRRLLAFCSPSGNPASKCIRWASALLGSAIPVGTTVDLNRLIGKQARAVVVVKQTADGREVNAVNDLLPIRKPVNTVPDPFE